MEFKILGPLEVWAGDTDVTSRSAKQRLLLSVLLLNANEVVSSDRLAEVLWGDQPPERSGCVSSPAWMSSRRPRRWASPSAR